MKRLFTSIILLAILSLLPGCGPPSAGPPSTPSAGSWITRLSGLPPSVRQVLRETFDAPQSRRRELAHLPPPEEELITDDPDKFNPGAPDYSPRLFLRAKEAAGSWIVEYEYGGSVQGRNVLLFSPDKAGILHRKNLAEIGLRTRDAEAAVSILLQKGRISP